MDEVTPAQPEKKRATKNDEAKLTVETAKALLELCSKQRAEECSAELEKLMKKHNCQLSGAFVFDGSGARVQINVVALEEK